MSSLGSQLIAMAHRMNESGLNHGTSGNLSVRLDEETFLITPSGAPYHQLDEEDLVTMTLAGEPTGERAPSSEWRIHRDIYTERSDAGAVLHAHPPWAMSVAALRRDIPPFHYMIMMAGGSSIRCAQYATYGTQELSDHAIEALENRRACLLANHGLLCLESSLERVFTLASEIEVMCRVYMQCLSVAEPVLLNDDELAEVAEKFATYGSGWKRLEH